MSDSVIQGRFGDLIQEQAGSILELHTQLSSEKPPRINSEDFKYYYDIEELYDLAHRLQPEVPQGNPARAPDGALKEILDPILAEIGLTSEKLHAMHQDNCRFMAVHLWKKMVEKHPAEHDTDYDVLHRSLDSLGLKPGSPEILALLKTDAATFERVDKAYAYNRLNQIATDNLASNGLLQPGLTHFNNIMAGVMTSTGADIDSTNRQVLEWSCISESQFYQYVKAMQDNRSISTPNPDILN